MDVKEKIRQLLAAARDKAREAKALLVLEVPDPTKADALLKEAEALRNQASALKAAQAIEDEVSAPVLPGALPMGAEPGALPGAGAGEDVLGKAVNELRFGPLADPASVVLREIYGADYRQLVFDQAKAFARYLRTGQPDRILSRQVWGIEDVKKMLQAGISVQEIKTTMVEGQDTLGGYAVPPQQASDILMRLPGLTCVRAGGATVVQTASNMIEWLTITGGSSRYPTALRGAWGTEVQSPAEKDQTYGLEQIPVHTYTYKVPMSQSLVEDASNLVSIFNNNVAVTLAIDEDDAFLIGDGAGKPRGILPSSGNGDSLTEVVTTNASALTVEKVKALRRGIQSQYRQPAARASWIANSDTASTIEEMQDGNGKFYFEDLIVGEAFLRHIWRESEAMPDIAGEAYPILFGDLSGYIIVERLGLSVVRFQDSATGINKVEFHVRRRLGGRLMETWKMCVQHVAAS